MFGRRLIAPIKSFLRRSRQRVVRRQLSPIQLIGLSFLAIIIIGTLLLELPISQQDGMRVSLLDCLFTATSATCVTGLVVVSTGETWTRFGQIVILAMIQIGGIGYMTIATVAALLLGLRLGLRARLHLQEAHGLTTLHDAMKVTRYIVAGTLIIELLGASLLALRFHQQHDMPWPRAAYEGVFYAISAFCNAGFDLAPNFFGLTHPPYRQDLTLLLIIGLLLLLGGLGFSVLAELTQLRKQRRLSLYVKLVLSITLVLILVGMGFFFLFEYRNPLTLGGMASSMQQWVTTWFMSVTPRTAGFSPLDISTVTPPSLFLIGVLMIIGASPNSTGGGVKTTTVAIIVLAIVALLRQRQDIEIFKRRISGEMVRLALALVTVYLLAAILVVIGISLSEITVPHLPAGPEATTRFSFLLFEVLSAFGTVGLSAGVTPELEPISRGLIILGMYLGRLGPLTFIFIFAQARRPQYRRLPSEPVMAG
jgi:trk system potassium uptake protein TrkH